MIRRSAPTGDWLQTATTSSRPAHPGWTKPRPLRRASSETRGSTWRLPSGDPAKEEDASVGRVALAAPHTGVARHQVADAGAGPAPVGRFAVGATVEPLIDTARAAAPLAVAGVFFTTTGGAERQGVGGQVLAGSGRALLAAGIAGGGAAYAGVTAPRGALASLCATGAIFLWGRARRAIAVSLAGLGAERRAVGHAGSGGAAVVGATALLRVGAVGMYHAGPDLSRLGTALTGARAVLGTAAYPVDAASREADCVGAARGPQRLFGDALGAVAVVGGEAAGVVRRAGG